MNNFNNLFIKSIRMDYGLSSVAIAKAIDISPTTLNRIEKCQTPCSKEIFSHVLKHFSELIPDFKFFDDHEAKNIVYSELKIWLQKYVDYSFEENLLEFKSFLEGTFLRYSPAYFEVKLLDCFYEFLLQRTYNGILSFDVDIDLLQSVIPDEFLYLAETLRGIANHTFIRNFETAKLNYVNAYKYGLATGNLALSAMGQYHLIMINLATMNHLEALPLFDSCSATFQKVGAYRRLVILDTYKATCYQNLGLYDEAIEILKTIETKTPQIEVPYIRMSINENLMWLYLKKSCFDESLKCIELARDYSSVFPDLSLAAAWDIYNLRSPEECLQTINKEVSLLSDDKRSSFVKSVLELMKSAIEGCEEELELQYQNIKRILPIFKNVAADPIIYSFMIDFYERKQDYRSAYLLTKELTNFLANQE